MGLMESYIVSSRTLILCHGFGFDAGEAERSPYPEWRRALARSDAVGFCWNSVKLTPQNLWDAWIHGRYNTYRYAWDLAAEAADGLIKFAAAYPGPRGLVAHSLGTRVARLAIGHYPDLFGSVVLLHGADYVAPWRDLMRVLPALYVLNVRSANDDVLNALGQWFAPGELRADVIGLQGLGDPRPPSWSEVVMPDRPGHRDHWPIDVDWAMVRAWGVD